MSLPAILIDVRIFLVTAIFLYKYRSKISSKADEVLNSLPETEEHIITSVIDSIHSIFQGVPYTGYSGNNNWNCCNSRILYGRSGHHSY